MREGIAYAAFTERGMALAGMLAAALGGKIRERDEPLKKWTAENFPWREALVFIGAAGIAVRASAPFIRGKAEDPAVIAADESGRWVIPLLSGHLGGANALARRIAAITGGEAVITTATDINAVFAVDLWAKRQGLTVLQPERIRDVSAALLRGEEIRIDCPTEIRGEKPALVSQGRPAQVLVSYRPNGMKILQLVPRTLVLGVGCRRGITAEELEAVFLRFCRERSVLPEALTAAASISQKRNETGLISFCERRSLPIDFYDAAALRALPGKYTASAFVERQVGVDNVCERAAVLASGGRLIERKYAYMGVTLALAERERDYDWSE